MKLIADVGNRQFYELRAIELISEAANLSFSTDYATKIKQAIGLLALAVVTKENGS